MKSIKPWVATVAIGLLALCARFLLDVPLPSRLPFITFLPAVLATSYFFGVRQSVALTAVFAFIGSLWIDAPGQNEFAFRALGALLFGVVSGACIYVIHQLKSVRLKCEQQERQLIAINRELRHRLKNAFMLTDAVCQQTIRSGVPRELLCNAIHGRLAAISIAYDNLDVEHQRADWVPLITRVLKPLAPDESALILQGPEIRLPAAVSTPMALILHELGTNAAKYGAWLGGGRVEVIWLFDQEGFTLEWKEIGGPPVVPPVRNGVGSKLIRAGVPKAVVDHEFRANGVMCPISLPTRRGAWLIASRAEDELDARGNGVIGMPRGSILA
jgi:two-component sensor histidine kinase